MAYLMKVSILKAYLNREDLRRWYRFDVRFTVSISHRQPRRTVNLIINCSSDNLLSVILQSTSLKHLLPWPFCPFISLGSVTISNVSHSTLMLTFVPYVVLYFFACQSQNEEWTIYQWQKHAWILDSAL